MRDKYDVVISSSFSADKQFYNALNGAFETFVNANTHSPEYISLFVDEQVMPAIGAWSPGQHPVSAAPPCS